MKLLNILWLVALGLVVGCEDFDDPNLDFSNNLPQYVELTSGSDLTAMAGSLVSVPIRMREAFNGDIQVGYEITGDITQSGSVTISQGDISANIDVELPSTTGSATIALVSVDNGLSLGRGGPDAGFSALSRAILW